MKNKKTSFFSQYKYDFIVGVVVLALILVILFGKDYFEFFGDRDAFQNFVENFGFWGPLILILAVILEVILSPIPGFVIAVTAGFMFGPIEGAIYVYIGNIVGTLAVFGFARKFGKPFIRRFFKKNKFIKYEKIISQHENWLLFFYFLPILPIDVISSVFGLSKIKFKKFLLVVCVGYIPYAIFVTNFGDYLAEIFFRK